jgi:hypothetical protein
MARKRFPDEQPVWLRNVTISEKKKHTESEEETVKDPPDSPAQDRIRQKGEKEKRKERAKNENEEGTLCIAGGSCAGFLHRGVRGRSPEKDGSSRKLYGSGSGTCCGTGRSFCRTVHDGDDPASERKQGSHTFL